METHERRVGSQGRAQLLLVVSHADQHSRSHARRARQDEREPRLRLERIWVARTPRTSDPDGASHSAHPRGPPPYSTPLKEMFWSDPSKPAPSSDGRPPAPVKGERSCCGALGIVPRWPQHDLQKASNIERQRTVSITSSDSSGSRSTLDALVLEDPLGTIADVRACPLLSFPPVA